jgi:hypothetical protein
VATKKLPPWIQKALDSRHAESTVKAWSDSDYEAKGLGRINLRLPFSTLKHLDQLAANTGKNKALLIEELVDAEHARVFEDVDPSDPQKMNLNPKTKT